MTDKIPIAILISGRGSNMTSLIEACSHPNYPARVALVLSNRPDAQGLEKAQEAGIKTLCIDHKNFGKDRTAHEEAIHKALQSSGAQFVCLAGYMRVLTCYLVKQWKGRMINIHPSLLPAFPGLHTHEEAIKAGAQKHGCTIHFVTDGVDEGPILAQSTVPVMPDDTADTLAARVLEQEHRLYPKVLQDVLKTYKL